MHEEKISSIKAFKVLFNRDLNRLKAEIEAYQTEEELWDTDGQIANSAGNLCLHILGNLNAYIGVGLGQSDYVRHREFEFAAKMVPRAELVTKIEETAQLLNKIFTELDDDVLHQQFPVIIWENATQTNYTLIHLYGHLNYHLGQINYHRRK